MSFTTVCHRVEFLDLKKIPEGWGRTVFCGLCVCIYWWSEWVTESMEKNRTNGSETTHQQDCWWAFDRLVSITELKYFQSRHLWKRKCSNSSRQKIYIFNVWELLINSRQSKGFVVRENKRDWITTVWPSCLEELWFSAMQSQTGIKFLPHHHHCQSCYHIKGRDAFDCFLVAPSPF